MNENKKFLFESICKEHGISLDLKSLAHIIGISASKANKIFMDYTEKQIIEKNILPRFKKIGRRRIWTAASIAEWLDETEKA